MNPHPQMNMRDVMQAGTRFARVMRDAPTVTAIPPLLKPQPASPQIGKFALLSAFANRGPLVIGNYIFDEIHALEHEDGSGRSFNVTGICEGKTRTIHCRTSD